MKDYIAKANRTASNPENSIPQLVVPSTIDLLHSAMGLSTEAGELLDMLKKHIFYKKPLDTVNAIEELGDICWYMALALKTLGTTFEDIMERNIKKLTARYPNKFTSEDAINRDLETERTILEANKEEVIRQLASLNFVDEPNVLMLLDVENSKDRRIAYLTKEVYDTIAELVKKARIISAESKSECDI